MAIPMLRSEEKPQITLPRRKTQMRVGRAAATSHGGLRRGVSVSGADAIGRRVGRGAADLCFAAVARTAEPSRGNVYPLRIAARVFVFIGAATVFYALALVAIFVQSDIVTF